MSAAIVTPGQCLPKMARQNAFVSHWNATSNPASSNPISKPPMPENKDTSRMLLLAVELATERDFFLDIHPGAVEDRLRCIGCIRHWRSLWRNREQ